MFLRNFEEQKTFKSPLQDPDNSDHDFDLFDDLVVIEHDAETYGWTFLSSEDEDFAIDDSPLSSAFSSMEAFPLPLEDLFLDNESVVRKLTENDVKTVGVSMSAWESDSDFRIPAFLWEVEESRSLSEEIFESDVFAVSPLWQDVEW